MSFYASHADAHDDHDAAHHLHPMFIIIPVCAGTEALEGRGLGMVSDRSPVYGSDHRAVVAAMRVPIVPA